MKYRHRIVRVLFFVFVAVSVSSISPAQDKTSTLVEPKQLNFGEHDIGTEEKTTLVVRNASTATENLAITIANNEQQSAAEANEFSWDSTCLNNLAPGAKCGVLVSFRPMNIRKSGSRGATLNISNGGLAVVSVPLSGSAFQNLGVSDAEVDFHRQVVNASSSSRSVVVTNYSDSTLPSLTATVTGDFTESQTTCEKIAPGASCAISVVFSPKTLGATTGSLTVRADQSELGKSPRVILLRGEATQRCHMFTRGSWSWNVWPALVIGLFYFAGLVLVRWHMIARPARAQVITQISTVRSRLKAESAAIPPSQERDARIDRINYLLDAALYPFKNKEFPVERDDKGNEISHVPGCYPAHTRFFNAIFWPRGQELAGWSGSHEAELELVELMPAERVRARLEAAEQELREVKTTCSTALADLIHNEMKAAQSFPAELERFRALLIEALAIIYDRGDNDYFQLASWHSKMIWLVGCALLFIVALAVTLQNAILLLMGGVGGLLSRLTRAVQTADVANDYGASWGALFLSPLSGALSAWGGILLIILGVKLNIFGSAMNVEWCNPYDPSTLAIALLLGFFERLFEGMATQVEGKFIKTEPPKSTEPKTSPRPNPPSSTEPASPSTPTISKLDPPVASLSKPTMITVKGSNFQTTTTATVTDADGNKVNAKPVFKDASTIQITPAFTEQKAFTSKLTITNPGNRSETVDLEVTN